MLPGAEHAFFGLNTLVDVSICRNFLPIDNTNSIAELASFLNFFRGRWGLINYLFSIVYVYFCPISQTLPTARFCREIRSFSQPESGFPACAEWFQKSLEIWRRSAFPSRQYLRRNSSCDESISRKRSNIRMIATFTCTARSIRITVNGNLL